MTPEREAAVVEFVMNHEPKILLTKKGGSYYVKGYHPAQDATPQLREEFMSANDVYVSHGDMIKIVFRTLQLVTKVAAINQDELDEQSGVKGISFADED